MTEKHEPVTARVQRLADGRGLVRCPSCRVSTGVYVIDAAYPTWLIARGYTRDAGGVWQPTKHHEEQRRRAARRDTVADRARLKEGRFGRGGDPTDGRGWEPPREPVYIEPPVEPEFTRSAEHRLPALLACPRCRQTLRVGDEMS